jgi:hypothetical protein
MVHDNRNPSHCPFHIRLAEHNMTDNIFGIDDGELQRKYAVLPYAIPRPKRL